MEVNIIKQYGVVHLKGALTLKEQESLFNEVKDNVRGVGNYPGTSHASSGPPGSSHRNSTLHTLGELLFTRSAEAVVSSLTPLEISSSPSLARLGSAASGAIPPNVQSVTCATYKAGSTMVNHCDLDRPLYTMSVAVGDSCTFTVGLKTPRPYQNENSGPPKDILMSSGDAIYFDGGSVPHCVSSIIPGTAPEYYTRNKPKNNVVRISVLFREPC
ncbi:hypothetical protein TL16_g12764 [Triparma laevis f. inornata]|uniref:Alpha-ketoglutarate-dependent dioxygenase AlkB-like domain-containing protein n=2 Tax=Triparma laevis TaxID=1534972 RepID=A0A9W7F8H7_9STRA|nr:hypothetical protein TL16_g12764 [Triparma laevis f. inornata]GMI07330.1 hypothetical protein TrLO_g7527 [Triparma laevis f. longispina]